MRRLSIFIVLLIAVSFGQAQAQQPVSSFETEDALEQFHPANVDMKRVQEHATDGEWAIRVDFPGSPKDTWPGVSIIPRHDSTQYQVLVFDVFNPADESVHLSVRLDEKDGRKIFDGMNVPPAGPHTMEIWVSGMSRLERVFPYFSRPREDHTLYFDNFRWSSVEDRFTALNYVDDTAPPEPTGTETERGFILFQRPFSDVVFPNSTPEARERIETVGVFAAPGEYEPATFSLCALEDLTGVTVSLDGLPVQAQILPVRCLNKRVTYSSNNYVADMPVLCERRETVDVAKGASKRWVMDMHVPEDAPAGIHEGTIAISIQDQETVQLPIKLRVLPYSLQEPDDMFWGEYYRTPPLAGDDEEAKEMMTRDMKDMRAHGMTSVGLCIGFPAEKVHFDENNECTIDLDGTTLYEHFMNLYRDLGYPMPIIQLSDSGQAAASAGGDDAVQSDAWASRYKSFWATMQQEAKERGWPEIIVQPVDEPGWKDPHARERNVYCLKLLQEIPGQRTEQDGPGDAYFHDIAGPYADVWNYNGGIAEGDVVEEAQDNGHIITLYNCDVESYRPEIDRYVAGWWQVLAGVSGHYNWSYISFRGSPYDDLDHKTGTWMHVYPKMEGEPGGPSTGWIGAREGTDDYRYIHTLRQTIARARSSGLVPAQSAADAAEAELEAIVESLEYSQRVRNTAKWTQRNTLPDGTKTIGGTLSVPNGWQHADYEKARWRVARATLGLLAAMGEVETPEEGPLVARGPVTRPLQSIAWTQTPGESAESAPADADRHVTIPVMADHPSSDGVLDDAVWEHAAKLEPFVVNTGQGRPEMPTHVLILSDGEHLYFGVTCHEDKMDYLTAGITREDGPVYQDDCVEIFVDDNLDRATFKQVMVNSLAVQAWNAKPDSDWRADSEAETELYDDRWTVELSIPMDDLGLTGSQFGLNVCRERRPMERLELSCWSPTGGGFGTPSRFGVAALGQNWIRRLQAPPAHIGRNSIHVTIRNEDDRPVALQPVLQLADEETGKMRTLIPLSENHVSLQPGELASRTYSYVLSDQEPTGMVFCLAEGGETVARRPFEPVMLPALTMQARPQTSYLSREYADVTMQINLGEGVRDHSRLVAAIYDLDTGKRLADQVIADLGADTLKARLDLAGLGPGRYELITVLELTDSAALEQAFRPWRWDHRLRLATESVTISRLEGPLD